MAPLLDRPTTLRITYNLSRRLRLWWCGVHLGAFRCLALCLWLSAFCGRLLNFGLFTGVVFANVVTRLASNLRTSIPIRLIPMIADQRTDTCSFALDGVERIDAGDLYLQLHACVFVKQIERPLGC